MIFKFTFKSHTWSILPIITVYGFIFHNSRNLINEGCIAFKDNHYSENISENACKPFEKVNKVCSFGCMMEHQQERS